MSSLLENLTLELSKLPAVGRRTAMRLALHVLKQDLEDADLLAKAIVNFRHNVKNCLFCNNISDDKVCPICQDTRRDRKMLCVVEQVGDLISIEHTNQYNGLYHVLGGVISPINSVSPSDLHVELIEESISRNCVEEVILALPTTIEGETTAFYLQKRLDKFDVKVSALSRGIGFGDEIEYADALTISHAIRNRRSL